MDARSAAVLSFAVLATLPGCGGSQPVRHPLRGTVRVDGVAIENGSISFLPVRGTSGTPATTLIIRGDYEFSSDNGPFSGRHRVVVGADPKQSFAVNRQASIQDRNQSPAPDVQALSMESAKLAPIRPQPERQPDPRQRRPPVTKEQDQAAPPPDPGRNQWETQYVVPAESTQKKDFDFATPVAESES